MPNLDPIIEKLVAPEYPDHVKIPDYWEEFRESLLEVMRDGHPLLALHETGDLKLSVQSKDHGRWLKLDGRSLSQAEIEAALGLDAGEAAAFVALMGTGGASKYGAAAVGKVKLKDARRKFPLAAGAEEDGDDTFSARPLTQAGGGVEQHKLTSAQSGIKAHGHGVTDPEHLHGVTDPGHAHGATQAAHSHRSSTGAYFLVGPTGAGDGTGTVVEMKGGTAEQSCAVQDTDSKQPSITVNNGATGVSIKKAKTGITIQNAADSDAAEAHQNMPPYEVLGYWFIRV